MKKINNRFYEELKEDWFLANNHPIALLRAENKLRNPWILSHLKKHSVVVDLGCGAGILAQALADQGHHVTGVDLSQKSLEIARQHDRSKSIRYIYADATQTFLPSASYDAVCAMDLLEHVEEPRKVLQEAKRVLKPGGLFFFHTFNRTLWSWLLVIKGVEWFIKNCPPHMHIYQLFIKPQELIQWAEELSFKLQSIQGVGLKWNKKAIWKMALTREVPKEIEFQFIASLRTGYCGFFQS